MGNGIGNGTGNGIVTQHVPQLPGMQTGVVGLAGTDKPGPTIRTVAVPAWQYIGEEVLYFYLLTFFGIITMDGMGLVNLAPASDAMIHIARVGGIAIGPTVLALGKELLDYLSQRRAARRA